MLCMLCCAVLCSWGALRRCRGHTIRQWMHALSTLCTLRCTVQVGDFGLARVLGGDGPVETCHVGTVSHQPPEMLAEGLCSKVRRD